VKPAPPTPPTIPPARLRAGDAPMRILVVDDDELDRLAVRRCLLRSSTLVQVDEAATAAEMRERIGPGLYDCVLLDYYLPGADALTLLGAIREAAPETPVVIFTGRGDEEIAVEMMKAGAADYLPKALLTPERLAASLRHAMELAHATSARRRAEEALHQQREWLRVTLLSIGDGVIAAGTDGAVTFLNPVAQELTGWTPEEAQGQPLTRVFRIVEEATRQPAGNPALRAMKEGAIVGLANHTLLIARDGTERAIDDSGAPIKDSTGKTVGGVLIFRDITGRKRAESLLRLSSEAAQHLLTASDPEELVRGLFEKLRRPLGVDAFFNYTVNDAGDGLRLAAHGGITEESAGALRRPEVAEALCGAAWRGEPVHAARLQESDAPLARAAEFLDIRTYSCYPLLAEYRVLGTMAFASRTKDELAPDELEFLQTVSHYVTAAYERLHHIAQLQQSDRRKDEFLATLAHELRNPLAPLRNMLELIKGEDVGSELLGQARDTMERQLGQMVRLVDDLLDVSRITRDKLELRKEDVQLASVVHQAVEAARPLAESAGHELTVVLPPKPIAVHADPVRLAQVFGNLLTNACKYTEPGGRIRLTVERQRGDVVVTVEDNGIGIPPEKLAGIFEIFSQVQSALERSQGGLGIGLTLVKRLTEMHGGSVEAKSDGPGRGSEFVVRLPVLVTERPAKAAAAAGEPARLAGRRILVVDDNRDAASSLALLLQMSGNTTCAAFDGQEAVEEAERFRPDVALLDIGLPRLNGYEACRLIRAQPWGRDMVIVAMTGWGQDEDRRRSQEAGFDHHMVKPVDYATLLKLLAAVSPERAS
jgi:PAS domain S-box-containing protein